MGKNEFDFPKEEGFQYRSAVYVPSKVGTKRIPQKEFNRRIKETKNFVNSKFQGSTSVKAVGSYTDSKGRIINEDAVIVENFTTRENWNKEDENVRKWLEDKQKEWNQEAIGVEYESPKKPRRLIYIASKKKRLKEIS